VDGVTAPEMTPAQVAARVAEIIRAHPERHHQRTWYAAGGCATGHALTDSLADPACRTTCCVAGWAVAVGYPEAKIDDGFIYFPNGGSDEIWRRAADLLGLDFDDDAADPMPELFEAGISREGVLLVLDRIAAGAA
jgi:hypothetical protein